MPLTSSLILIVHGSVIVPEPPETFFGSSSISCSSIPGSFASVTVLSDVSSSDSASVAISEISY